MHGVFSDDDADTVGVTRRQIRLGIDRGEWRRKLPRTYAFLGTVPTFEQDLAAAYKWAGEDSAVCRRGAARLWKLDSIDEQIVEVTSTRRLAAPGITIYRAHDLHLADVTRCSGLPTTTPTRTLLDLAGVVSIERLERALESALRRGLTHMPLLLERYEDWRRKGRTGAGAWRKLLELRGVDTPKNDSDLETRMTQLLRRFRLPMPDRQVRVSSEHRVDFIYESARVVIEVHGARWHKQRDKWEEDLARHNRLTAMGWIVLHFTYDQVTKKSEWVAEQISLTLDAKNSFSGAQVTQYVTASPQFGG